MVLAALKRHVLPSEEGGEEQWGQYWTKRMVLEQYETLESPISLSA